MANAQNVNGTLRVVKGDVQIKSGKTGETTKARIGQQVFPQDVVITGAESRAKIVMVDNNEINVSPDSQVEIQHYEFDPGKDKKEVLLNVLYGKVRAKVEQHYDGKTSKFEVKTPSAVAGVRGTDFMTSYNQSNNSSQVVTFRGAVQFGTPGPGGTIQNPVSVTPGKTSTSAAGGAPSQPSNMPKDQLAKVDHESNAEGNSGKGDGDHDKKGDRKPSGNSSGNGSDSRGPASTGPSVGGPAGGGSTLVSGDLVNGTGGTTQAMGPTTTGQSLGPPPPPPPPPLPPAPPPPCQICSQITQSATGGNTAFDCKIDPLKTILSQRILAIL